jgi:hypothetical protein
MIALTLGWEELPKSVSVHGNLGPTLARRLMRWTLFRTAAGAGFGTFIGACVALLAVKPTMSGAAFGVLVGRPAVVQVNAGVTVPTVADR